MKRLVLDLVLLFPTPVSAQSPAYLTYLNHAVESMDALSKAGSPDEMMLWADAQVAWAIANPPEPCYVEGYVRGVAVAETVRAVAWMSTDLGAATVGTAYLDGVLKPAFDAWVVAVKGAAC